MGDDELKWKLLETSYIHVELEVIPFLTEKVEK